MQTVSRGGTRSVGIAVKILAIVGLLAIAAATIAGAGIAAEVEKFGKPLLANLTAIEAAMAYWSDRLEPDRKTSLDAARRQLADFVTLRTETVRAGREQGPKAADTMGNNDANRSNRQALNATIVGLAAQNAREVETLIGDLAAFRSKMVFWLSSLSAAFILGVVLLASFVVIRGVTRPLAQIATAMRSLADGVTDVAVTGDNVDQRHFRAT